MMYMRRSFLPNIIGVSQPLVGGGESDPYTKHGGLTGGPAQHIAGAVCEAVNLPPKQMVDDDGDGDPYWLTSSSPLES